MNSPLKILHIIPNLKMGGAERLVVDIVSKLHLNKNISVKLVLFQNITEYDVSEFKEIIHCIPSSVKLSVLGKNKVNINELNKFINEFKPDIIHTHLFEAEIVSRSCNYPQAKWFTHCHGNMEQFLSYNTQTISNKQEFTNFYEKTYLFDRYNKNGGTTFLCISEDNKRYFEEHGNHYPTHLLPNAINYHRFFKNINAKPLLTEFVLVSVGTLNTNKNHQFLIDVFHILQTHQLMFQAYIVGEGDQRMVLEKKIKQLNLGQKVKLVGNTKNVDYYFKNADIYLHSSKSEGFGLTLIEAMAAGLPVITLDGKGNRDFIEQGKNGYMLFDYNPFKFAETIAALWNDQNKYHQMSVYAQQFAKQYDIEPYVDKLLNIYNK